jgi:hypothetical protein
MRRRVTLARALLHKPELLIIDEPTLGIDAEARHAIWEHIRLLRARGTTVMVASNYLDEVQALCDTAAVLHEGRLVAYEAPASLVAQAGQCLDLDCAADAAVQITGLVQGMPGVSRSEVSPSGLTVFLRGDTDPDDIVRGCCSRRTSAASGRAPRTWLRCSGCWTQRGKERRGNEADADRPGRWVPRRDPAASAVPAARGAHSRRGGDVPGAGDHLRPHRQSCSDRGRRSRRREAGASMGPGDVGHLPDLWGAVHGCPLRRTGTEPG